MIYLSIGISAVSLILFIWWFPKWQTRNLKDIKKGEKWQAENEFRKTLIQITGGIIIITGIFLSWQEFNQSREEFRQSQGNIKSGQISSRYSDAIKLLSEDKTSSCIGAIYALEQIAIESPNYLQTVLDVLTAFVKNFQKIKYKNKEGKIGVIKIAEISGQLIDSDEERIDTAKENIEKSRDIKKIEICSEVQVALTVIGRIRYKVVEILEPKLCEKVKDLEKKIENFHKKKKLAKKEDSLKNLKSQLAQYQMELSEKIGTYCIDLSKTQLYNANLNKANLIGAKFSEAKLSGVELNDAKLMGANLSGAELTDAKLRRADLRGIDLSKANLRRANLSYADLRKDKLNVYKHKKTNLSETDLREVDLSNAYLNEAKLTEVKLSNATLCGADLSGVDLSDSNLYRADLSKAKLNGTCLSNADFSNTDLTDATGLEVKQLNELKSWYEVRGLKSEIEENLIRIKVKEIENMDIKNELFRAGVLLWQMGDFEDAKVVFSEFERIYPAWEVYNNIGACYFNSAQYILIQKFSKKYLRFRLYTAIGYSTSAEPDRGEGNERMKEEIRKQLEKSISYFKEAASLDKIDKSCRYNLSAALILMGNYAEAREVCDSILDTDPQDVNALNNKAIALYYINEKDPETTREAIGLLEKAHQLHAGNFDVLYNLGSLKKTGTRAFWEKYLKLPNVPRDNFYDHVYQEIKGRAPQILKAPFTPELPIGINIGMDFTNVEGKWGKENTKKFNLALFSISVLVKDDIRVVALEGEVVIVEKQLSTAEKIEKLRERFGPPQRIVRHNSGNFYVYEDQDFSIKEINGKARSYIWFEKKNLK
jgi:uncharacterized protein YjbI with pentapeptide repeats